MTAHGTFLFSIFLFSSTSLVSGLDNGLGLKPPMGYNSWYDVGCSYNENLMMTTIDAMISKGLYAAGYNYFNLDDCWAGPRNSNGQITADINNFPSGTLKPLADYAHSKGMKFGCYTDRGTSTCAGRPGSLNHETIDAQTYASWGVDWLKEDSCSSSQDPDTAFAEYAAMRDALNATGRPIYFGLCGWNPWYAPVGYSLGNHWRIAEDDSDWAEILVNIDFDSGLEAYAGPGGWNSPCLLTAQTAGNAYRITELQTRAQFSLWAILSAPLIISANVRNISAYNLETYLNQEVIAVSQDALGLQGIRLAGPPLSDKYNTFTAHVLPCDVTDVNQQWKYNTPMTQFLSNGATNKCLNLDDCSLDVIYYSCVTTGGTCCGATCYQNEQFIFNTTLTSPLTPSFCAEAFGDGTIFMMKCKTPVPDSQMWSYSDGLVYQGANKSRCLSSGYSKAPKTNVWGRKLSGNQTWAVAFFNADPNAILDITCDANCFKQMGFTAQQSVSVRDLWSHTDLGKFTASSYTVKNVPANGGLTLLKFSLSN